MPKEEVFRCEGCGDRLTPNPRLERWMQSGVKASELRNACLCWVCARLAASVDQEARELRIYYRGDEDQAIS